MTNFDISKTKPIANLVVTDSEQGYYRIFIWYDGDTQEKELVRFVIDRDQIIYYQWLTIKARTHFSIWQKSNSTYGDKYIASAITFFKEAGVIK